MTRKPIEESEPTKDVAKPGPRMTTLLHAACLSSSFRGRPSSSLRPSESARDAPMMTRKAGKIRSAAVQPFHSEYLRINWVFNFCFKPV